MKKVFRNSFLLLLLGFFFIGCAASKSIAKKEVPTFQNLDRRNEQILVVKKFEEKKGESFFFNDFKKKGTVCPLCQF